MSLQSAGGKEERIEGEAVFVEMGGYVTRSKFLEGFVEMNDEGEIIVDSLGQTSRKGVFAAGDITQMPYKQVVISAGQGATAALSAYNYLQKKRGKHASNTDWRTVDIKVTG
ncbi:FAD-dependent oxidoreductase [Thermogymnomonas acidicola]|uniref:FAD-dependent oxidoreductase n=1 Tax=Thermogymnomonas acidicola TaxID=399579 RepID=UPI0013967DA1|nr:FAD-dependent oxidoreductase [Thermogymnomonas acidicola]